MANSILTDSTEKGQPYPATRRVLAEIERRRQRRIEAMLMLLPPEVLGQVEAFWRDFWELPKDAREQVLLMLIDAN